MIKFIKNNWKDPVWSKVFASIILSFIGFFASIIWIIIQKVSKNISFHESLNDFIDFITINITIPLWLIFIFIIILVFIIIKYSKKMFNIISINLNDLKKEKNKIKEQVNIIDYSIINSSKIFFSNSKHDITISSKFLNEQNGIFYIWAYVTDIHNQIQVRRRYMYIVSYSTNNGNPLGNPSLANYPNAWAIQRITPNSVDNNGIWRFWCNNITKETMHLDYNKPLKGGWHLFTIAWSKEDDYIKFIIDNEIVAEKGFLNWPSDISGKVYIGTWPNRESSHFFNSNIGPWKFEKLKYDKKKIDEFYKIKPE